LGGFINLDQLNEIFAIKPEQISEIKPFLTLDITKINFIDVNRADYLQLNAHPYISAKEAKAIIAYRQQHSVFNKIEDLEKIYVLNKDMIQKVRPYLKF
jgi:predicted DNA-binding helix-hairpin-helix protein